jgi:hypothetical protein
VFKTHQVQDLVSVDLLLNGALKLPKRWKAGDRFFGLDGRTLVFTAPAGTVTFADPTAEGLTVAQMSAQIMAAISTISLLQNRGDLWLVHKVSGAVDLVGTHATSTASDTLGFADEASVSGTAYNPPDGVAPKLVQVVSHGGGFALVTEES